MAEVLKLVCVYLLAVCVLLDKSVVLSSCVTTGGVYCYEGTDEGIPYVWCEVHYYANATVLADVLTSCTVGEPYQRLYIRSYTYYYGSDLELSLNLGSNITELYISGHSSMVYIDPLRQHLNLTKFVLDGHFHWETRGTPISSYFPNLVHLEVSNERDITTLANLLSNLTFLSSLTWKYSSLTNISDDSFKGLSSLSYVDLSYNRITYLSSESFEHLPSLLELIITGNSLNCTCQLQWMSVVDTNGWVDVVGECEGSGLSVDSPSTYSQCHNTESYQCFNKSMSCENVCINTPSSYVCACDAGYGLTLLEAEEACHDIDECVQDVTICQGQSCRNTLGSYECYCSAGFVSGSGGDTCVDVDECMTENGGCEHICTNTAGSYTCGCYPNTVNQSINSVDIPVSNAVPVLIAISVIQTISILVLGITLTAICYLYWKRGQQQKPITEPNQANTLDRYTELQVSESKSQPESQRTYMYLDEDVIGKYTTSTTSPEVKSSSQVYDNKSRYMNLSDM